MPALYIDADHGRRFRLSPQRPKGVYCFLQNIRYLIVSDSALCVEFGNEIQKSINAKGRALAGLLTRRPIDGVTELVPTYRSLLVHYNPVVISHSRLVRALQKAVSDMGRSDNGGCTVFEIPVLYGGEEFGPDLEYVAQYNGLTPEQVVKLHSKRDYLVYMLGFTPGFPYLGGMDARIATPRLDSPRTRIPAGSVGIAGEQTGIYPIDSPGGWQLIGRTPIELYNPERQPPILFSAGDYIRFVPVNKEEYQEILYRVENGTFVY